MVLGGQSLNMSHLVPFWFCLVPHWHSCPCPAPSRDVHGFSFYGVSFYVTWINNFEIEMRFYDPLMGAILSSLELCSLPLHNLNVSFFCTRPALQRKKTPAHFT